MQIHAYTSTGRLMTLVLALGCSLAATLVGQRQTNHPGSNLRALYDTHQWFRLRQAAQSVEAPVFFRGAIACAFNDTGRAIEDLGQVIRSAPSSDEAYMAHELLTYIQWRAGRYRQAFLQLDALSQLKPNATDVKESRKLFAALAQFPEQSVSACRPSKLRYNMDSGNLFIPVIINGQNAVYMVDTGANLPVISAAEAKRRRLKTAKGNGKLGDSILYSLQVGDVALADELTVGGVRINNVSFLVVPDDRFADMPPDQRGVLGLPVLLAFETLRWSADGTFEIALPATPAHPATPTMYFDGAMPVTQVEFRESKLDFALDTGAVKTDLYPRFSKEFATFVKESGRRGTTRNVGVGGTFDLDSIILPELSLRVSGFATTLRPARVLLKDVGSEWHYGNLGLDLLSQARVVTLNFKSMTLALQ
jgi:hypothetical protein